VSVLAAVRPVQNFCSGHKSNIILRFSFGSIRTDTHRKRPADFIFQKIFVSFNVSSPVMLSVKDRQNRDLF
jgi:hypothetical protein